MAGSKTRATHLVSDPALTRELVSPLRQELIDTLEALGGEASVATLAEQLGRPADGLYYHLRKLSAAGLITELADAGDGQGRRYQSRAGRGGHLRLHYQAGADSEQHTHVRQLVRGLLGMARRDFEQALDDPSSVTSGPLRTLWASRGKGWLGADELTELNQLLLRLLQLLGQPRSPERDTLISLVWMLAPQRAKPKRRKAGGASAHSP